MPGRRRPRKPRRSTASSDDPDRGTAACRHVVPARRNPAHPHRLRPCAVPAVPAAAGDDAANAVWLAAGVGAQASPLAGRRHRDRVHARALDHARARRVEAGRAALVVHRAGDRGHDRAGGARQPASDLSRAAGARRVRVRADPRLRLRRRARPNSTCRPRRSPGRSCNSTSGSSSDSSRSSSRRPACSISCARARAIRRGSSAAARARPS